MSLCTVAAGVCQVTARTELTERGHHRARVNKSVGTATDNNEA